MIAPKILDNDKERLENLRSYKILDTLPEKVFDDIVRIASRICQTSIATITFIDKDRQWFKARQGIEDSEGPRELSFCAHTITQSDQPLVIEDARKDNRFHDNPLTINSPYVVFYVGIPLISENGHALGTLCVIDNSPKSLKEEQILALKALASQIMNHLELRKKTHELIEIKQNLEYKNSILSKTKENLEEALKAKSIFLSMMSHEIRSPLYTIVKNINLLLEASPRKDQQESLLLLKFTGETLLAIINDIFDSNRLKEGKSQLGKVRFNLKSLVQNIVDLNQHRAKAKGNEIVVKIAKEVPTYVGGDSTKLVQVLFNLVSNAIKFTDNGIVTIQIVHKSHLSDSDILSFEIIDTGIGIPSDALSQIFKEFVQVSNSTTRLFGGTGLGLAITSNILALYESQIKVQSQLGYGSTFSFELEFSKVDQ